MTEMTRNNRDDWDHRVNGITSKNWDGWNDKG